MFQRNVSNDPVSGTLEPECRPAGLQTVQAQGGRSRQPKACCRSVLAQASVQLCKCQAESLKQEDAQRRRMIRIPANSFQPTGKGVNLHQARIWRFWLKQPTQG